MKNYVIYGDTVFAEEIFNIITIEGRDKILAFTNDRGFMGRREIKGLRVIPFDELGRVIKEPFELLLAYGYTMMNNLRKKVYNECKEAGLIVGKYISTNAICYSQMIEEGTMIWPNVYIGPGVCIGCCNIIQASCTLAHDNELGDFNYLAPGVVLGGRASMENHCFIGLNSTIKSGTFLKDYTLLGSGCNILRDSERNGAYVGNPARILDKRSMDLKI